MQKLLNFSYTETDKKKLETKNSFTNANLDQYTADALAYMQAQRFFIEHSIKESTKIQNYEFSLTPLLTYMKNQFIFVM